MKRVIQRKAKQGICDELLLASDSLKKRKRASQDIGNKTRTSAAMLGLALSFGASGSILSCHNKRAIATEPPSEGISSVQGELEENSATEILVEPSVQTFSHVIREGETLWTLADYYGLSSETVAKVNGFENNVVLSVGQVVQIPHTARIQPEPVPVPLAVSATLEPQTALEQPSDNEGANADESREESVDNLASIQVKATPVDIPKISDKRTTLESQVSAESLTVVERDSAVHQTEIERTEVIEEAEMAVKPSSDSRISPDLVVSEVESLPDVGQLDPSVVDSSGDASALEGLVSVSVDQPLLVAESIAFSGLQDESSAVPVFSIPDASLQPVSAPNVVETHQIQVGETLASIAQRYGISTQQLAAVNGIRNPNRIFAGRVLNLPDSVSVAPDTLSDNAVVPLGTVITVSSSIEVAEPGLEGVQVAAIVPQSDAVESNGFYVQRLLSEIETMTANYRQSSPELSTAVNIAAVVPALDSNGVYSPVASAVTPDVTATLANEEELLGDGNAGETEVQIAASVINPQFPTNGGTLAEPRVQPTVSPEATVELEETQLLAAAPLGSENYVPLSEPVTGRMVSPTLPPLLAPENYLPTVPSQFNGYIYPAQGTLTSGYGWRWGRMHRGIDVAAPVGTPIVAAAPGVVEFAGWNSGGYGNMVDIRHSDGSRTRYAHNNRNLVRVGQQVSQGEQIAEMGSTGYSTGPHVHFEIHLPEQGTVNPVAYLSR